MESKKDTRWVAALVLGLIAILTFWSVIIPLVCVLAIIELYN